MQRRRSKPHSFEEQLSREKARLEAQLANLSGGPERDALTEKIRQIETASYINEWLSSPGLKPPDR
jgi:cell division protein FtsB